jgi:uncharacterized protein
MILEFEWDEDKNQKNIAKHGISFEEASLVFEDPNRDVILDNRKNYHEIREIIISKAIIRNDILILVVVTTDRKNITRIISARKAKKQEITTYYGPST